MKQEGLEPFDLWLDAPKVGTDYFATWTLHGPGATTVRSAVDHQMFDFTAVLELSNEVNHRLEELVETTKFGRAALSDPDLVDCLTRLNAELYTKPVGADRITLRKVFADLLGMKTSPTIRVGGAMRLVPWELTSPDGEAGVDAMLGSRALIVGSTHAQPVGMTTRQRRSYHRRHRLNVLVAGEMVRLRAIGNMDLTGAGDEAQLARTPGPRASGTIAPAVTAGGDLKAFFRHFETDEYDLVHVFAHCQYDTGNFRLGVSDKADVTRTDFNLHDVRFPSRAFHFLNICQGGPAPRRKEYALVDYLALQQEAGAVVAPLTSIRSSAAVEMAREFYARFLPAAADDFGRSAAEAVTEARNALWGDGLATGYLYRAFGRSDLVLGPIDKVLETENV